MLRNLGKNDILICFVEVCRNGTPQGIRVVVVVPDSFRGTEAWRNFAETGYSLRVVVVPDSFRGRGA